jgi:thymidylate synthase
MKKHPEYQYLDTLAEIINDGEVCENRTRVSTRRILGVTHRYNFKYGFPLFTTKRVWWKGIAHELLWFLKGSTNIKYLVDNDVNIWNDDAYNYYLKKTKNHYGFLRQCPDTKEQFIERIKTQSTLNDEYTYGDLGPVYGQQWRNWQGSDLSFAWDQIQNLIDNLKNNPTSRRHIVSAWNPGEIDNMALPPCHILSQYSISDNKLWCHVYQRSCDMPLGVPFNVASYSLLTYIIAHIVGIEPGGLIWTGHDVHIYENQIDGIKELLQRKPLPFPKLLIKNNITDIDDFTYEDFEINNYKHHPAIHFPLSTG